MCMSDRRGLVSLQGFASIALYKLSRYGVPLFIGRATFTAALHRSEVFFFFFFFFFFFLFFV